jgi:ribosomal protein S18 acetylase RimI-like enzyme
VDGLLIEVTLRTARADDDAALLALDRVCWDPGTGFPSVLGREHASFFGPDDDPGRTVVAERDGRAVGFGRTTPASPLPENAHVWMVDGLAVHPEQRGRGIGRALLGALAAQATAAGARKLSLRVLGTNPRARAVYERAGFVVEGVLREEFVLDGTAVDDVLMALRLPATGLPVSP